MIIRTCLVCKDTFFLSTKVDGWFFKNFHVDRHIEAVMDWEEETEKHMVACRIAKAIEEQMDWESLKRSYDALR